MNTDRVTGAAKSFAGKAEGAIGHAAGDAKTEASGRLHEAEGTAQKIYGQVKDGVMDAANDLGDTASGLAKQAIDAGGDYYREGSSAVAAKIQEQPLGALLIAGVVGFALAMMLSRPSRRPQRWADRYR